MSMEAAGWYMDAGPPVWNAESKTFSFFLQKQGCRRVLCILEIDALETAVQSKELPLSKLTQIFDTHRQMIELRAAQKLNAKFFDADGCVRIGAADI